jgi:hypothetical protein
MSQLITLILSPSKCAGLEKRECFYFGDLGVLTDMQKK